MIDHVWQRGDSLSRLAVDHGFADWRRIWDNAANNAIRTTRGTPDNLQEGDIVRIPDREQGEDTAPTENETRFVRLGLPVGAVTIVDDNGNPRAQNTRRLAALQVSNLVTTSQLPANILQASTDRDNFKVEVVDTGETGNRIPANRTRVEILRPDLNPDGTFRRDAGGRIVFIAFNPERVITGGVDLRRVPGTNLFRSRYFRLVSDFEDFRARDGQTLLADHDPTELRIEILDQIVRVTYTTSGNEPLRAEATVGVDRLRFRVAMQAVRRTPGGALFNGLTLAEIHRHVCKWIRRTFSPVNMAPKLMPFPAVLAGTPAAAVRTDPNIVGVREVDPPENLVVLSNRGRNTANANERIRFRVRAGAKDVRVDFRTGAQPDDRTPRQIADLIAPTIRAAGFTVTVDDNARHARNLSRSADLLILDPAGERVIISEESTSPGSARTRIGVGRLNPVFVDLPDDLASWNTAIRTNRVLARNYRSGQDRIDCFLVGRMDGAVGAAWPRSRLQSAILQPLPPVLGMTIADSSTCKASNDVRASAPEGFVHSIDHEFGHVLIDMIHFNGLPQQLMTNAAASGIRNTVFESKRMADRVLTYREFGAVLVNPAETAVSRTGGIQDNLNPTQRARTTEAGAFIESF